MQKFDNFIFDWDGTLADSPALHEKAFRKVLSEDLPEALSNFDYTAVSGCTTREVFANLCRATPPEKQEELVHKKQALYRRMIEEGQLNLLDGARALLSFLKSQNKWLFLVTGGSRGSVEKAINATDVSCFFSGIITADDINHGKPNPESFLLCINNFNLNSAKSVVIEDAQKGVAAAHAAGLYAVGVHDLAVKEQADVWFRTIPCFLSVLQKERG